MASTASPAAAARRRLAWPAETAGCLPPGSPLAAPAVVWSHQWSVVAAATQRKRQLHRRLRKATARCGRCGTQRDSCARVRGNKQRRHSLSIAFYTNKTPPKPEQTPNTVDGPEDVVRGGFRGGQRTDHNAHIHTWSTIPGYCITGLARTTRQRQGHNGAGTSRRRHLHFDPSRSGWDTTPMSTTG